jgi:alpha-mannosidase
MKSKYPDIKVQYSKATDYFDAVYPTKTKVDTQFPTFSGDFFPYADSIEAFWTGYFVSRAELKDKARQTEHFAHVADSLFALSRIASKNLTYSDNYENLFALRFANGLVQHHDAITGTEKPFVEANYLQYLENGLGSAITVASKSLLSLLAKPDLPISKFQLLPITKVSYLTSLKTGDAVPLILFNSLGWNRQSVVRVRTNLNNVVVLDQNGKQVTTQVTPAEGGLFWLSFSANIPALAVQVYSVRVSSDVQDILAYNDVKTISNSVYDLTFTDGKISQLKNKRDNLQINLNPQFLAYDSYAGPGQASGAYIFRSAGPNANPISYSANPEYYDGQLYHEVRQQVSSYIHQTTRLYKNDDSKFGDSNVVEFNFRVGPVPGNKEVVVRFNTNINNNRNIRTDNNGLISLERSYRNWPNDASKNLFPTSSNFYPFVYHASISDNNQQFTVVTNTSRGVASLVDGALEIMLQRRCLQDDSRGVGVPMNDTGITSVNIRVVLGKPTDEKRGQVAHQSNYPIQVFGFDQLSDIIKKNFTALFSTSYNSVAGPLPDNVHLLTLQQQSTRGKEFTLLRAAHIDQYGAVSAPIEFGSWFKDGQVNAYKETALDGLHAGENTGDWTVQVEPLQIRTFLAQFAKK